MKKVKKISKKKVIDLVEDSVDCYHYELQELEPTSLSALAKKEWYEGAKFATEYLLQKLRLLK